MREFLMLTVIKVSKRLNALEHEEVFFSKIRLSMP